ncbi:Fic family protein [Candidatus Cyanaurora vandensis]|uniref:Fic family protein n=1 Tax=Candidatus Cyanaurora vandensis TaxID=2714958 RepID=UPI00257BA8FB|nr:Fic family protein [Candidatus Cyanaurora vandensis]
MDLPYKWTPITPLSDQDRTLDLAAIASLYESWKITKVRYQGVRKDSLNRFNEELIRRLSIETGILERLYDLDYGTTEALVASGFVEDLISRSSTNIEPSELIGILQDHEAAIKLVMDAIAKSRPVTRGFLHELHAILTRHQKITPAVDKFGNYFEIPLLRGKFKEQPNNPRRPDGKIHEYCPVISVDSEVDHLLKWLQEYENEDPVLVAAWLHHRFTQIHPYQDGNGRLGRTLTTLVLLRADLLPIVIDRSIWSEYISVLEKADFGDLGPLVQLFARLERRAILQGLSITDLRIENSQQRALTSEVIDSLTIKFQQRRDQQYIQLREVNDLAQLLRSRTQQLVREKLEALKKPISYMGTPKTKIILGGPENNKSYWYKNEVINSSKASGNFINFSENHYFVKATIEINTERLVFIVSFHHVGRDLTGVMEVTAFARFESGEENEKWVPSSFFSCSLEPFVITWKTSETDVGTSFEYWLDIALAMAIQEYADRL